MRFIKLSRPAVAVLAGVASLLAAGVASAAYELKGDIL